VKAKIIWGASHWSVLNLKRGSFSEALSNTYEPYLSKVKVQEEERE